MNAGETRSGRSEDVRWWSALRCGIEDSGGIALRSSSEIVRETGSGRGE